MLVACGSYSPCTFLHLRMFEMARGAPPRSGVQISQRTERAYSRALPPADHARANGFVVVGGYLSPVNDKYQKKGLAASVHRVAMCELAVQDSDWLMVDAWEAQAPTYTPTAQVLDHFHQEINVKLGGVEVVISDEWTGEQRVERRQARIMLLAGSDLILTMSEPGVWSEKDVRAALGAA